MPKNPRPEGAESSLTESAPSPFQIEPAHTRCRITSLARLRCGRTLRPPRKPARKLRANEQTYYRWRKECGGLKLDQARRLMELEGERQAEAAGAGAVAGEAGSQGCSRGKLLSPERRRPIIALASAYGRYGYRRITALLRGAGGPVGRDRVQRIWRRAGISQ